MRYFSKMFRTAAALGVAGSMLPGNSVAQDHRPITLYDKIKLVWEQNPDGSRDYNSKSLLGVRMRVVRGNRSLLYMLPETYGGSREYCYVANSAVRGSGHLDCIEGHPASVEITNDQADEFDKTGRVRDISFALGHPHADGRVFVATSSVKGPVSHGPLRHWTLDGFKE